MSRQTSKRRRADGSRPIRSRALVGRGPTAKAPPALSDGRVRCLVCRNAVKPNPSGTLRGHRDLFGHQCYNRRPPEEID